MELDWFLRDEAAMLIKESAILLILTVSLLRIRIVKHDRNSFSPATQAMQRFANGKKSTVLSSATNSSPFIIYKVLNEFLLNSLGAGGEKCAASKDAD